ncbi:MAG: response regulator [Xanthomonadales bacterium]|jgi:DNA-binding response OmpR family regulator|nr:response regulator [Xanthomonadales bacterium]
MAELILFEDNKATRDLLSLYLGQHGHHVIASAGTDTPSQLHSGQPVDLVLLDLDLGSVSGASICQQIRQLPAPYHRVPIVILSCSTPQEVAKLNLQVDGFILKMTSLDEILLQINRFLEQQRQQLGGLNEQLLDQHNEPSFANNEQNPEDFRVLNEVALSDLQNDIGAEVLLEIMEIFIQDLHQRASSIHNALNAQDCGEIHAHAHALKSSAATYGAEQLAVVCTNISLAYQANQDTRVQQHALFLGQVVLGTIRAVMRYTQQEGASE